jgi:hypothetical protein
MRRVVPLVVLIALMVGAPAAGAADFTSTGGNVNWSAGSSWVGGVAPSGTVGTLFFPSSVCTTACGITKADIPGLTATTLSLRSMHGSNGWALAQPALQAYPLTLTGGIDAAFSDAGETRDVVASLTLPIVLGAPNTWTVNAANLYASHEFSITGNHPLAFSLTNGAAFRTSRSIEVGPVTVTGGGTLDLGISTGSPVSLNATTGNPTSISGSTLQVGGQQGMTFPTGPLTATNTSIVVNTGRLSAASVALDAGSSLKLQTTSTGTEAGNHFSALTSTGAVDLGGAKLGFYTTDGICAQPDGTVLTLVSTTGTLTGTFGNAPDGGVVQLQPGMYAPCAPAKSLRINYNRTGSPQTVTGTIQPPVAAAPPPAASGPAPGPPPGFYMPPPPDPAAEKAKLIKGYTIRLTSGIRNVKLPRTPNGGTLKFVLGGTSGFPADTKVKIVLKAGKQAVGNDTVFTRFEKDSKLIVVLSAKARRTLSKTGKLKLAANFTATKGGAKVTATRAFTVKKR